MATQTTPKSESESAPATQPTESDPNEVVGMYCGRPILARHNLRWGSQSGEWIVDDEARR